MKRRTTNFVVYDNDNDDCDGHMEIVVKTVKDNLGSYTDYTLHVGDTSLLVNRREFQELRGLMDEVGAVSGD